MMFEEIHVGNIYKRTDYALVGYCYYKGTDSAHFRYTPTVPEEEDDVPDWAVLRWCFDDKLVCLEENK